MICNKVEGVNIRMADTGDITVIGGRWYDNEIDLGQGA